MLPDTDATTIPAVRNHHSEPAGGPRRWRGGGPGGRNAVLPEPYGYAALAAGAALSGRRDFTTTTTTLPSTSMSHVIAGTKILTDKAGKRVM